MPHSYHNLLYHIIYSTHERRPWMDAISTPRIHAYTGGIIRNLNGIPLAIGGVEEHIHLFARLRPDKTISDVMRIIKSNSSGWVHKTFPELKNFAWQEGYTAFTVSESQAEKLIRYIANQTEHHHQVSFKKN